MQWPSPKSIIEMFGKFIALFKNAKQLEENLDHKTRMLSEEIKSFRGQMRNLSDKIAIVEKDSDKSRNLLEREIQLVHKEQSSLSGSIDRIETQLEKLGKLLEEDMQLRQQQHEAILTRVVLIEENQDDLKRPGPGEEEDRRLDMAEFYIEKEKLQHQHSALSTKKNNFGDAIMPYFPNQVFDRILKKKPELLLSITLNDQLIQFLSEALVGSDQMTKIRASWLIGFRRIECLSDNVKQLLGDPSEEVRLAVCEALLKLGHTEPVYALKELLKSEIEFIMINSVRLLVDTGNQVAIEILRELFEQAGLQRQREIVSSVGFARTQPALSFLEEIMIKSTEVELRREAHEAADQVRKHLPEMEFQDENQV